MKLLNDFARSALYPAALIEERLIDDETDNESIN
jgi:hypothetical protein